MDIRVSFTGTRFVRQTVEATLEVDGDFMRQAMIDEYGNDLGRAMSLGGADFSISGTEATVTFTVEIADDLHDLIVNNRMSDVYVIDTDMDGAEDWDDIEDVEVL
jgi:hypothetical protein